jgi:hypothetical protein
MCDLKIALKLKKLRVSIVSILDIGLAYGDVSFILCRNFIYGVRYEAESLSLYSAIS